MIREIGTVWKQRPFDWDTFGRIVFVVLVVAATVAIFLLTS